MAPLETEAPVSQNRPTGRFFRPIGKKAPLPIEKKAPPLKYLLECSDGEVGAFELAKLSEVANLRSEMLAMFDKLVDSASLAVLAAMLRRIDRQELVRQLLESPDTTIDVIMAEAKAQIRNQRRRSEELEDGKMPSPWLVRTHMTLEEARKARNASVRRYQERNNACQSFTEPFCRESSCYCEKHLSMQRDKNPGRWPAKGQ